MSLLSKSTIWSTRKIRVIFIANLVHIIRTMKCKDWSENKGKIITYVYFEFNLVEVYYNTQQIDSGCTTLVTYMIRGFISIQSINPNEKFVLLGNRDKALAEAIGTYRLTLDIEHRLNLFQTLVFILKLDSFGYFYNGEN